MEHGPDSEHRKQSYQLILDLLDRHGLLTDRLPFTPGLFEEALFFCYKMRLITQGDVKRLMGVDRAGLKKIINEWNTGDEGNCTCRLARNPFADDTH